MVVIIDNYDSFTYNLAHLVKELGTKVDVLRNDQLQESRMHLQKQKKHWLIRLNKAIK